MRRSLPVVERMFNKLYCAAFEQAGVVSRGTLMLDKPLLLDRPLLLLGLLALAPRVLCAQSSAPDTPEPGSVEEIAQATTEVRFLSPWVAYLPASASVVSPRAFLHRIPGAAGELVNSSTAYGYCRALAGSSARVRLFTIGRSEEGRDIVMLAIADEKGIQELERLRAATAALADPRTTDAAAAERIVASARPIYYFNRDAHQQVHETTKAVFRMFREWHPQVIHDLHESVALLVTWNGTGPINQYVDPLTYAERLELSFHEVQALTALGMPGVWTWNFGDDFAHLYLDAIATNHNSDGRGYETFGNGTAETLIPEQPGEESTVEWYRPLPPPQQKTFSWSARDNVNYNETAMLAALDESAQQSKSLLRNFYLKALHSWRKGLEQAPYAFLIPDGQGDPARVAQLLARLLAQGIEVQRAATDLTLREGTFPAGTYVVRLDQPYRNYAVDLLAPQNYPRDAGEPYDDVSWELPAHYHLAAIPTADPRVRAANLAPLSAAPDPQGAVSGSGPVYLLKDGGQEGLLEARYQLARFRVSIAERAFTANGAEYPPGSWILAPQAGLAAALHEAAAKLALEFTSTASVPDVASHAAPVPRLGLWVPWAD